MITVFTATYNRGRTLRRVYDSLVAQSSYDFEWLLINDGSTDNTEAIVSEFIGVSPFPIRYISKINEGLMRTINLATELAQGELFFRVDSDDYILPNAIESIKKEYAKIEDRADLCGLVFLAVFDGGKIVGNHPFVENTEANFFEYRYKFHAIGDRAEVIKTEVFRKYKFPTYEGEKFVSESIVWNRMALDYNALYINYPIYVREYLEDSITSDGVYILMKNPQGEIHAYAQLLHLKIPKKKYITLSVLFFRGSYRTHFNMGYILSLIPLKAIFHGFFPGTIIALLDKINPELFGQIFNKLKR